MAWQGALQARYRCVPAIYNPCVIQKTQHVLYKGGGPALVDLIGGQVQMFINNPLTVIGHIKNGRVRSIAIAGESRLAVLPQVPTFTEAGLLVLDAKPWFCVLAPASTPQPIIRKLSTEIVRILTLPDVLDYLAKQRMAVFNSIPVQLAVLMKTEMARWAKVIKTANIRLENEFDLSVLLNCKSLILCCQ